MRIKSISRTGTLSIKKPAPVKVEEPKKEIPQPVVEVKEEEEIVDNPDDGEGEG